MKNLHTIGRNVKVDFIGHASSIPAKIDTGADSSSVWASNIRVDKTGHLSFTLFDKGSKYYTGEIITRKVFKVVVIKSSHGHQQLRYKIVLSIRIADKRIKALFTLADRSSNTFPVLIGRRLLTNKFLIDVSKNEFPRPLSKLSDEMNEIMVRDPYRFYKKHIRKQR